MLSVKEKEVIVWRLLQQEMNNSKNGVFQKDSAGILSARLSDPFKKSGPKNLLNSS